MALAPAAALAADADLLPTGAAPSRQRPASAHPVMSKLASQPGQAALAAQPSPSEQGVSPPRAAVASAQKAVQSLVLMRRTLNALSEHYAEVQDTRASATSDAAALRAELKAAEKRNKGGGSAHPLGGAQMAQLATAVEEATRKVQSTGVAVSDPIVDDTLNTMTAEYTRTARAVLRGLEGDAPHMVGPVRELLAVVPEFHATAERRRSEAEHARKSQRRALLWRKASFATSMLGDEEEGGSSSDEEGGVHEINPGQSFRLGRSSSPKSTPHRLTSPFADSTPPSPTYSSPGSPALPVESDLSFLALALPAHDGKGTEGQGAARVRTSSAATRLRRAAQRAAAPASPTIPEGTPALSLGSNGTASEASPGHSIGSRSDTERHLEDDITEDTDLLRATHDGLLEKVTSDLRRRQLASSFAGSFKGGKGGPAQHAGSFSTVTMSPKRRSEAAGGVSFSPPQNGGSDSDSDTEGVFGGGRLHHAARRLISALRVSKAVRSTADPRGAWGNTDAPHDSLPSRAEAALVAATASLGGGGVLRVAGGGIDADEDEIADESHADRSMGGARGALGPAGEELAPSLPLAALAGGQGHSPPAARGHAFMAAARSSMLRPRLATEAIAAQVGEALPPGEGMRPGLAPDQGGGGGSRLEAEGGAASFISRPRASRPKNMSGGCAAAAVRATATAGTSPRRSDMASSLRPWSAGHATAGPHSASLQPVRPATAQAIASPSQRPSVSLGPAELALGRSVPSRGGGAPRLPAGPGKAACKSRHLAHLPQCLPSPQARLSIAASSLATTPCTTP